MSSPEYPTIDDLIEQQQALQTKLWSDQYYEQGMPIVRLLGDLTVSIYRKLSDVSE